jgi:nucleoside-diphosphate-sugar epimerase
VISTVTNVTEHGEAAQRWRTGPVAVTGASGQVGSVLLRCLEAWPNELRPLGRGDDIARAFADADAVVHLAGTLQPHKPNTYRTANLDTVLATVAALARSRVQRVVFLSFLTARLDASNSYLRYKAEAEEVLRACGLPATIFRCGHIYGPPSEPGPTASAFLAKSGTVTLLGSGTQQLTPLYRDDAVEAILHAALDPDTPTGTFDLAGPDTMTAGEFARLLNRKPIRIRRTPAMLARLLGHVVPTLAPELVDVILASTVLDEAAAAATARRFGVELHRVADVWRPQ